LSSICLSSCEINSSGRRPPAPVARTD